MFWSETGELCCIATEESYFVLKYDSEAVAAAAGNPDKVKDKTLLFSFRVFEYWYPTKEDSI